MMESVISRVPRDLEVPADLECFGGERAPLTPTHIINYHYEQPLSMLLSSHFGHMY